ncbi:MAG TPA: serine/threonine-protein kinase [Polyangiaceae bacterium]
MQRQEVPERLGRYQVLAKIGEGGMASVYLGRRLGPAIAEDDDTYVALKVIKDEFAHREDFVAMFLDEVKIVASLRNPSIVRLLEFGQEGKRLYCALELVMGQSLWRVWDACKMRRSRLRYDWIAWVGARIAEGLHVAHELRDAAGNNVGFVHRDVSPSNVLVSYDGRIKIIDFGLAKAQHRLSKTTAGVMKGKYAYMAPEQARTSSVDRRADVFSLGVTLWEISCDRRLFKRKDDVETLIALDAAQVPDPCALVWGYPRPLWRVLRRALRKEPDKRYATALDMARELDACATLEGRTLGSPDIAKVLKALFPLEAERDAALLSEASTSLETGAPMSIRTSVSSPALVPEDWKAALPPGLLNDRTKR